MTTYIEYKLDENSTILVEAPEDESDGVVRAVRKLGEIARVKTKKTFKEALKEVGAGAAAGGGDRGSPHR